MKNRNLPKFDRLLNAADVESLLEMQGNQNEFDLEIEIEISGELLELALQDLFGMSTLVAYKSESGFIHWNPMELDSNQLASLQGLKTNYLFRYYAADEYDPCFTGIEFMKENKRFDICVESAYKNRKDLPNGQFEVFDEFAMQVLTAVIGTKIQAYANPLTN